MLLAIMFNVICSRLYLLCLLHSQRSVTSVERKNSIWLPFSANGTKIDILHFTGDKSNRGRLLVKPKSVNKVYG